MKKICSLLFLLLLLACNASAQESGYWFYDSQDRQAIRASAQTSWGHVIIDSLDRVVTGRRSHPLAVPLLEGGHLHDYFCPRHNVMLNFDWDKPTAHFCSECGEFITGDKRRDWAWVNVQHARNLDYLVASAYLYLATGQRCYAEYVRDMLLDYARVYPTYFEHNTNRMPTALNSGRMFGQSLDESVWASDAARAFSVAREIMTPQQIRTVEQGYLRVCADMLLKRRGGGNWQVWHNSGLVALGVALGDDRLIETALDDPQCGYRHLMSTQVYDDGWWNEGSPTYHYYPLRAMLLTADALRCRGIGLFDEKLYRMFASPAQGVYADLVFPAHNDGWYGESLTAQTRLYELAYARFGTPLLRDILSRCYRHVPRSGCESLYNPDGIPPGNGEVSGSVNFEQLGVGILRCGERTVVLKYGPYGGGHGHPDKLSVSIHNGVRELLPDLGTSAYGVPAFREWYRKTLAHNTVCVDAADQRPVAGVLSAFDASVAGGVVEALCEDAYPGVSMKRRIVLGKERLQDTFTCCSDSVHTYDYVLLLAERPEIAGASEPAVFDEGGAYGYISGVRKYPGRKGVVLQTPSARIGISTSAAFDLYVGSAPGVPASLSRGDAGANAVCYPILVRVRDKNLRVQTEWKFK